MFDSELLLTETELPRPSFVWLREYDLTEPMRRDKRSLLAVCLVVFLDIQFGLIEGITAFGVHIGTSIPAIARYWFYAILPAYFGMLLASRYFGIFFSGRMYDAEQASKPIIDEAADVFIGPEEDQGPLQDDFEAFMQKVKDSIAAEIWGEQRRYTAALAIRTIIEIYVPLLLGLAIFIWSLVKIAGLSDAG